MTGRSVVLKEPHPTEYRYITAEQGDLRRRFDPTNFRSDLRKDLIAHIGRVGFHHAWSAQSDMLGSFVYGHSDTGISSRGFDLNSREESYIGEIQNIYRGNWFSLTGGLGHYSAAGDELSLLFSTPVDRTKQVVHDNVYLYSDLHYHKRLQLTLGVSADFYTRDETFQATPDPRMTFNFERNRVNPKVGILWSPMLDTTVRLAGFRVIQRSLPSNQTLEPTQVVGFNQFFDDAQGVAAWRYGVGLDQRFSLDLYGGAELSTRDLELFHPDGGNFRAPSWQELLGRAHLYWAPHPWWALSAEYYYERLNRELNELEGIERVTTHRVPLGFSFIHPSGLSFRLNPTFVHQEGDFRGLQGPGEDSFVVVGAGLSYRLPKRYGLLNLGVENLFDADFRFQETDVNGPLLEPERQVVGTFTFSF